MIQNQIQQWLEHSLTVLQTTGVIDHHPSPQLVASKQQQYGDYSSNIALSLAKHTGLPVRQLAEQIIMHLPHSTMLRKVEVAGAGFINFYVKQDSVGDVVAEIVAAGADYGVQARRGQRVLVEFVSANPTGPLHIGHGRAAAYGETLCSLLDAGGYEVEREYYLNDRGRQIDILATSVWLRYLELKNSLPFFPAAAYQGDYIYDLAAAVRNQHGSALDCPPHDVFMNLSDDGATPAEITMDVVMQRCQQQLGDDHYALLRDLAVGAMRDSIGHDLQRFGVLHQHWFSEHSLYPEKVTAAVEALAKRGFVYSKDGARWFCSSRCGDEKDRVLQRDNGSYTYLAGDIAYHINKFERGYDLIINVWGADHHGYIARLRAAMQALGYDIKRLQIILFQFVALLRGGRKLAVSTRSGEFLSLRAVCEEVGIDAARLFYVMRKAGQHVDFDLDLAKSHTTANPVYYIQYAHARICSVFKQAREKAVPWTHSFDATLLSADDEAALLRLLMQYPSVLLSCVRQREPLPLVNYLRELAACFHAYYNHCQFLVADAQLRDARLTLITAVRQLLVNGLKLLGSSAPERM